MLALQWSESLTKRRPRFQFKCSRLPQSFSLDLLFLGGCVNNVLGKTGWQLHGKQTKLKSEGPVSLYIDLLRTALWFTGIFMQILIYYGQSSVNPDSFKIAVRNQCFSFKMG